MSPRACQARSASSVKARELFRLQRERRIDAAVRAAQREVLLDDRRAEATAADRRADAHRVIRQADLAAEELDADAGSCADCVSTGAAG